MQTRVVDLTPESIVSNARYWGGEEQVPRQALTCGMDLLLSARRTLLETVPSQRIQCVDQESTIHDLTIPILWLTTGS